MRMRPVSADALVALKSSLTLIATIHLPLVIIAQSSPVLPEKQATRLHW
jgi:hypothetical protein